MINFISPNIVIELIAAIFAYFYLRKDRSRTWQLLMVYVIMVVVSETFGRYIAEVEEKSNHWLYNCMLLFEIGIMLAMFAMLFKKYLKNLVIIYIGLTLSCLTYAFELYDHGFFTYNSMTRNAFSILLIVYALTYFYLFLVDKEYVSLRSYAPFWWVSGVLLFYSGSILINLSFSKIDFYISDKYPLRYLIYIVLNLILYALWSYSFYCRNRQQKTLSK